MIFLWLNNVIIKVYFFKVILMLPNSENVLIELEFQSNINNTGNDQDHDFSNVSSNDDVINREGAVEKDQEE
jgi:hypothetical protein